ncbi:MAG: hypothetical protein DRQ88_08110 [Epsilonproteobacteria bacterium]|nr:MAG: hypothetical protein DRQ89_09130 [Campylobacterota bacterium]RLA66016.1 MAG: hypothetical protein DRQ88_08110 [Campylobacterota bacterium]
MKKQNLIILLGAGIMSLWALSSVAEDDFIEVDEKDLARECGPLRLDSCEKNLRDVTKVEVKGEDGKFYSICTGQVACGGSLFPVSCKVSKKEACPTAKICMEFVPEFASQAGIPCGKLHHGQNDNQARAQIKGGHSRKCPNGGTMVSATNISPRDNMVARFKVTTKQRHPYPTNVYYICLPIPKKRGKVVEIACNKDYAGRSSVVSKCQVLREDDFKR